MYCISYKFTLLSNNSETRRQFIEVWAGLTQFFKESCGALGSRLHYADDGCFYAYAQWPSLEVKQAAGDVVPSEAFGRLRMKWAELAGPSEVLWEGDVVADMLVS